MPRKSFQNGVELANMIKERRKELGLTIEEAASKANVGTKTWCRYETGESIRNDKVKGVCKALNWLVLPTETDSDENKITLEEYRKRETWSKFLENEFGPSAALSFVIGSDLLEDNIEMDLNELASMPAGTHVGQLDCSLLSDSLPEQFLTRYSYELLYCMKCTLNLMKKRAQSGVPMTAHSVIEELILYLCTQEAEGFMELCADDFDDAMEDCGSSSDWVFDLFDDMDIVTFLYSEFYLTSDNPYHFDHWNEYQFYTK